MAITETIRNLDYPSVTNRTVILNLVSIIPIDNDGDEIYSLSATSTSTSRLTQTTINPILLREFKAGYSKSSGYKNPPFTINSSNNKLKISIDGSTYSEITLASGIGLSGDDVADDIESKIAQLSNLGQDQAGDLGFLNVTVEYVDGRFRIISGTVSNTYTGTARSSVLVSAATSGDASSTLGFDIPIESQTLSSKKSTETTLASAYTSGTLLNVNSISDFEAGNAFSITDGTNREYFTVFGVNSGTTTLDIVGSGLAYDYDSGSVVQKIFERDPSAELASPYEDVDSLVRWLVKSQGNQISFS